jgi:abortive infection bacteriophage resistance protein
MDTIKKTANPVPQAADAMNNIQNQRFYSFIAFLLYLIELHSPTTKHLSLC